MESVGKLVYKALATSSVRCYFAVSDWIQYKVQSYYEKKV